MSNTPAMSHKRKRSYEGLPGIAISNSRPTKIPTVDLNTLIQDSDSLHPLTSFNTLLPWPILIPESPPSSESSQASYQRFPLTKRNLHQLNRINKTMASNPSTPEGKSQKTKATATSTSQSVQSVRKALKKNNIYLEDSRAEERGTDLIDTAKAIIKGERKSSLKKEQGLALRDTAKKYQNRNELTFLTNIWKKFLNDEDTRFVKTTAEGELEDREEAIRWIETAWEKDHLSCNWGADFKRDWVSKLRNLDASMEFHTEKIPRVKNPRPDLTYGLSEAGFSKVEQNINDDHGAGLSVETFHPFFIVEAKIGERPIDEAELQCARGGAAMLRLKRKFDMLAEGTYDDEEVKQGQKKSGNHQETPIHHYQVDTKSFVFSLALVPRSATMFVHWAEEAFAQDGTLVTTNWHANHVAEYFLRDGAPWIELHRDIDNVLDWGTLTRKQELRDLCKKIHEHEQSNKRQKT